MKVKYTLRRTKSFEQWFTKLDNTIRKNLLIRLGRVSNGNFGDYKVIDTELSELRFFFGSSIRVYFTIRNQHVILFLSGGDKGSQTSDINKAREILKNLED